MASPSHRLAWSRPTWAISSATKGEIETAPNELPVAPIDMAVDRLVTNQRVIRVVQGIRASAA